MNEIFKSHDVTECLVQFNVQIFTDGIQEPGSSVG